MEVSDNLTANLPFIYPDLIYSCQDENLSSTSVTAERWESYDPRATQLSVAIILLVYMVIGLPCNLLIIISMLWNKLYRQPAHILLLNLALNDFLTCATFIPINVISAFAGEFIFGTSDVQRCRVCQINVISIIFFVFNLHVLALLSLDRFIFIKAPLHYSRWVTIKTTLAAVTVTWIFCIIISIPPLFGFGEIRFTSVISTCFLFFLGESRLTQNVNFEVFSIVEAFAIPIPILTFTNIWIILIIRRQMKKMRGTKASLEQKGKAGKYTLNIKQKLNKPHNKRQLRVIKIYALFFISNIVTWTPNVLNTLVLMILTYKPGLFSVPRSFHVANYLLFMSQVVLHPIIQASMIPEIRKLFVPLLCWRRCKSEPLSKDGDLRAPSPSSKLSWCGSCWNMLGAAVLPASGATFINGNSTRGHSARDSQAKQGRLESLTGSTPISTPVLNTNGFSLTLNSLDLPPSMEDRTESLGEA